MNNEVVYVRTPSTYDFPLADKHLSINKIYKATKANTRTDSQLYNIVDNLGETRDILLIGDIILIRCMWLLGRDWQLATEEEYNKQENIVENDTKKLTRAECFREYARVIEMCEGSGITPQECIRINGKAWYLGTPTFTTKEVIYTFAIRIHEGKPVFEGDTLYYIVDDSSIGLGFKAATHWKDDSWECVSWTKPVKKTCLLNGEELPIADSNFLDYRLTSEVYYRNKEDRDKVRAAITKLLKGEEL